MLVSESAYYRVAEQFGRAAEWRMWEVIIAPSRRIEERPPMPMEGSHRGVPLGAGESVAPRTV